MKRLATALTMIAATTMTGSALAETTTGNAAINVLSAITFVEDTTMNFGDVSNTDGTCTMASGGGLSGICTGTGTPAQFTVSGTASQAVAVSVGTGSTDTGATLTPTLDSSSTPTLDVSGDTVVDVVGSVALSSATSGTKALTYVLTVNYN